MPREKQKLRSKAELRREIENKTSNFSWGELSSSKYFLQTARDIVVAACKKIGRVPGVNLLTDPNVTAYTDNEEIYVSTKCDLFKGPESHWEKFISFFGLVFHECCHVLYTDFVFLNKAVSSWVNTSGFKFYPYAPNSRAKEIEKELEGDANASVYFGKYIQRIENIFEDVYVENMGFLDFGGLATMGLSKNADWIGNGSITERESYEHLQSGQMNLCDIMHNFILITARGYELKTDPNVARDFPEEYQKCHKLLDQVSIYYDRAAFETNTTTRLLLVQEAATVLYDAFKECVIPPSQSQQQQGGLGNSSQSGSSASNASGSNSNGTMSAGSQGKGGSGQSPSGNIKVTKEVLDNMLKSMSQNQNSTAVPKGNTAPVNSEMSEEEKEEAKKKAEEKKEAASNLNNDKDSVKRQAEQEIKKIAENECQEKNESIHKKQLKCEADEFGNYGFQRNPEVSSYTEKMYNSYYEDVREKERTLTKKLEAILKKREAERFESGHLMGSRFNARDIYHRDGKYFSRKFGPDETPDVAFGLLIDESGSMYGNKAVHAKKVAILLERVLQNLNIPLIVVGHNSSSRCYLYSYVDFDTCDGKDKYRIAEDNVGGCNADGAAITYVAKKLLEREEESKVLIVISDGCPTGNGPVYPETKSGGTVENAKGCVDHFRKKGVNIFGSIIDGEYENIERIYGKQYSFDCRNLDNLQSSLIRLCSKYILK